MEVDWERCGCIFSEGRNGYFEGDLAVSGSCPNVLKTLWYIVNYYTVCESMPDSLND